MKARLAVYKLYWEMCIGSYILAVMEAAVSGGVGLLSISLGSIVVRPYYNHMIAVGALGAIHEGIFVRSLMRPRSCLESYGNSSYI